MYNLAQGCENSSIHYTIENQQQVDSIPSDVQNIYLHHYNYSCNIFPINNTFSSLHSVCIGYNGLQNVDNLVIEGLPNLEIISIGRDCSKSYKREQKCYRSVRILNCPRLYQIHQNQQNYYCRFSIDIT